MAALLLVVAQPLGAHASVGESAGEPVVLADATGERQVAPVILTPRGMDPILADSVKDLQRVLAAITGVSPVVMQADHAGGQPFIAVGDHALVREHIDADAFDPGEPEGYAIRTVEGGLLLTGATDRGSSIAIYQWLHELGCRWFFPGEVWEQLPRQPRLELQAMDIQSKPRLLQRRLWYGWGVATPANRQDHANWQRRNRLGGHISGAPGHAYARMADPDELFDAHPEWFALVDGKRTRSGQLCLSNEELQQHVVRWAVAQVRQRPDIDLISASPNDGGGYCECNECAAMGSEADQTLHLANLMAEAVTQVRPDCYIGLYAYYANCMPPSFRAHPNVIIYVANGFIAGGFTFEELLDGWSKMADHIAVREYFDVMIWSRDLPQIKIDKFKRSFALYDKYDVTGVTGEASNNWGAQGLNYYVVARLMWEPDADVEAVIEDFYTACWGPAASAMRAYYDTWKHLPLRPWSVRIAFEHLNEAAELAGEDATLLARVDLMRAYMHWVWLYHQHREPGPDEQKVDTARRAMHFSWRLANTNIVHSYGHYRESRMWQTPGVVPDRIEMWKRTDQPVDEYIAPEVSDRTAPVADEDDLGLGDLTLDEPAEPLPPIELLAVLPHDIVEQLVRADLEELPRIEPVHLPDFSPELIALSEGQPHAEAGDHRSGDVTTLSFPRSTNVLHLWVDEPGRVTVSVEHTTKKSARDDTWRLQRPGQSGIIAQGASDPLEPVTLTLPLNEAGAYSLRYASFYPHTMRLEGAKVSLSANTASPLTLAPGTARHHFHVPADTERFLIEGYSQPVTRPVQVRSLTVRDGDGQPALQVADESLGLDVWPIRVPAGQDGRVWTLELDVAGNFNVRLFGIPQLVAPRVGDLLVPRNVHAAGARGD